MAFSTVAFTSSVAASQTNADVPGVADGWASLNNNNHYLFPQEVSLLAAYHQGTNAAEGQINAPSLRSVTLPQVQPVNVAASPGSLYPVSILPRGMFKVPKTDEVAYNATTDSSGAARNIAGLWVGDGNLNVPQGQIFTARFTASITAGNLGWGFGAITLTTSLPTGRYAIVGMDIIGANLIFARVRFPNGGMLPGCIARQATNITPWWWFRFGNLGVWGEFDTTSLPGIELFGSAAPTTQTGWLDIIKLR